MNKEKTLSINMIASIVTLVLNLGINFFLSDYIVNNIGVEAYGFVNLANSMANYAVIITVALNSVAGRFITIAYHKDDKKEANQYFNSVLMANIVMAVLFAVLGLFVVTNLDKLINIPAELVVSVKQLYTLVFLNFMLSIISTVFTVATFITNRLYISSLINAVSYTLKAILFIVFFSVLPTTVSIVGLVMLICTAFVLISNIHYTRKLVPDIKIRPLDFSMAKVKKLFASGVWSSISSLSQTLSDGLDLLISNLFISSIAMGQLSVAKTLSNILNQVVASISNLFAPQLTYHYAKNDTKSLLVELRQNMLLTSAFANIPAAILVAFGHELIQLWVPTQDADMIYVLLLLTIFPFLDSPPITGMYNVFLITNRLKMNSLFWFCISIFDVMLVFLLLNTTDLGILAIAGVSTSVGFIANMTFMPIYAATCLKQKKTIFYPIILRYFAVTVLMVLTFVGVKLVVPAIDGWPALGAAAVGCGIVGLAINYFLLFGKAERDKLQQLVSSKLLKRGKN